MELKEKAWEVPQDYFEDIWFAPNIIVFADTRSKAKVKAMKQMRWDDYKNYKGQEIDFLNIKVVRNKFYDRYLINGEVKTKKRIEEDLAYLERENALNELLVNHANKKAYIKKGTQGYYADNYSGYSSSIIGAGIYTVEQAVKSVKGCSLSDGMEVVLVDSVEHNLTVYKAIFDLNKKIEHLKTRLITD